MTVRVRFSPGVFVWGHVFQRGDLPLYIQDATGNPASPSIVQYTMFRYVKGNPNPVQVGPCGRTPVTADLGEYYATGVAGECGQPGDWFVQWVYQEAFDSQKVEAIFPFKVFNSADFPVACATSTSSSSCGCKRGAMAWSCRNPCPCGG